MYYDGTKLLSLKDLNGKEPEIYMIVGNRSAGKTTYFNRLLINRFIKRNEKFMLLYRYQNELTNISDKFFKDVQGLFFNDYVMTDKNIEGGKFKELFLSHKDEEPVCCGYAVSINKTDIIKKNSHYFSDVSSMLMDEFQAEDGHYVSNEVEKLISVHTSVARGNGKMTRRVPVYLLGNTVSMLNPYFTALNISNRLDDKTKFLRGDGWVLEQCYNDDAAKAQQESSFNLAFKNSEYIAYASENVYLHDNLAFIEKPSGRNFYVCTIKYDNRYYGIKSYTDAGIIYCDDNADMTYPQIITVNIEDHNTNSIILTQNEGLLQNLRNYFRKGLFRFKNLECKNAVIETLKL